MIRLPAGSVPVLVLVLGFLSLLGSQVSCTDAGKEARLDGRFDEVRSDIIRSVEDGEVASVSVAVAEDGKVIWEESFGWADKENKIRATPHTLYRLGSISKTFTATALMILVEDGKVDLDEPIVEYLGGLSLRAYVGSERDVTVRNVLNHRAGMPPYHLTFFQDGPHDRQMFEETVRRYGIITFQPGGSYIYCNLGYNLTAYLISHVSAQSFPQFVKDNVFTPLGMPTAVVHDRTSPFPQAATQYTPEFTRIPPYSYIYPGAEEVYCSAHELIRYAMFHLKNRLPDQEPILSDEALDHMQAAIPPSNTVYGIGWGFDVNELGYRSVHHGGEGPGVDNFSRLFPSENVAVVILCNNEWGDRLGEIQEAICTALIPEFAEIKRDPPSGGGRSGGGNQEMTLPEVLLGTWEGKIVAHDRDIDVVLEVSETEGARVRLAGQPEAKVDLTVAVPTFLLGEFPGTIPTPDGERYPARVRLALVRKGDRLSGQATAVGWMEERQAAYELSSWIEMKKRER
jgi:CubicO group peptidase (beta-lactamase class C family)